jgi:hypothetical protein
VLKKGQIKFTKKAAEIAKVYFKKKKIDEFLIVAPKSEKPEGGKDFYKILLGEKQDSASLRKVYATDIVKAKKLFEVSLIKEGRLSFLLSPDLSCLLYIDKTQQDKYEKLKTPGMDWPMAILNEGCETEFERKMNKSVTVDLANLISSINA